MLEIGIRVCPHDSSIIRRFINLSSSGGLELVKIRRFLNNTHIKNDPTMDMYHSLSCLYLEKRKAEKLQEAGIPLHTNIIAEITRREASRRMDPALWRLAMAQSKTKRFFEETHVLAAAQCGWSRHLHIDCVAASASRQKCQEMISLMEERGAHVFNDLGYVDVLKGAISAEPCFEWCTFKMASGFDTALNIGGVTQDSSQGFSLRMFSKPSIVLAHVAFKGAALAYYFLANWLSSSFIVQFLVILTLLSMDFWTVKNITGRLLVGLRWWNFVDDNGNNHWKFESAKWEWMIVALLGLSMNSANLYAALLCGAGLRRDTNQFTNYLSKWAFLSVLRRQAPPSSDPLQQTI
ncbi:hypothetical protein OSTOST_09447 [Ostertagia ostertagi]